MRDLEFDFKPSRRSQYCLLILSLLAWMVILSLPWGWAIKAILLLILFCYVIYTWAQYVHLSHPNAVFRIRYREGDQWLVQTRRRVYEATLIGDSVATPLVSVLRFKVENQFFPIICLVLPDSLKIGMYRQLMYILHMN